MKKVIYLAVIALSFTFVSCGYNKEEKMLHDYVQKGMMKTFNVEISELDFKINNIKKIGVVKASDSMNILKVELATLWKSNPSQELIDTLSFKFVKNVLSKSIKVQDTLYKGYHDLVLLSIKSDNYIDKYKYKQKREKAMKNKLESERGLLKVENIEKKYKIYSKKPDSILQTKYEGVYSIVNPVLKVKQTFDKTFYTNAKGSTFVSSEDKK